MNRELAVAFHRLRVSERVTVLQDLNLNLTQSTHESNLDYATRILQKVSCEGLIRELENAMLRFQ
jgi:hypothetical protein